MKVRAKLKGYYQDKLVKVGQVFNLLDENLFSKKWMVRLDGKDEEKSAKKGKGKKVDVAPEVANAKVEDVI